MLCAAWPTYYLGRLLLVRGLSAESKLEELRPIFPEAHQIVIAKDKGKLFPNVGRRKQNAAITHGYDG